MTWVQRLTEFGVFNQYPGKTKNDDMGSTLYGVRSFNLYPGKTKKLSSEEPEFKGGWEPKSAVRVSGEGERVFRAINYG